MSRETSLPTVARSILEDAGIPLPNEVVRVLAEERQGKETTSEQLARVASYQREAFLRTRNPPSLCFVIDRGAVAVRPRVWALGEWRLARRISTPDVQRHWQSGLAVELLDQILLRFPMASDRLRHLALEAVARILGPVAAYLPGNRNQWEELRKLVVAGAFDPDPAGHTSEQWEAERSLLDYKPPIAPSNLYFGLEISAITRTRSSPLKLRLPAKEEDGEPFDRVAARRLGGDQDRTRRLLAYIQGWSFVQDELERSPTSAEYADRWKYDLETVRGDEAVFAQAFPEENSPERIVRLLNDGLPRTGQLARMMGVLVVDSNETTSMTAPAVGQEWKRADGAILTITTVEGVAVIGRLEEPTGESILWASGQDKLRKEFHLVLPQDVWLVTFDVDVQPSTLLGLIAQHQDLELERYRRPSDPRPNQDFLRAGTIQLQVMAADAEEARAKVVAALAPRISLSEDEVRVRSFTSST